MVAAGPGRQGAALGGVGRAAPELAEAAGGSQGLGDGEVGVFVEEDAVQGRRAPTQAGAGEEEEQQGEEGAFAGGLEGGRQPPDAEGGCGEGAGYEEEEKGRFCASDGEIVRCGGDSNPCIRVLQTRPLNRLGTAPTPPIL